MEEDRFNKNLTTLYGAAVSQFLETSGVSESYVGPFLVSCPEGYSNAPTKWMYVGQETYDWAKLCPGNGAEKDVQRLMDEHAHFALAKRYRGRSSPFWTFAHDLDQMLNPREHRRKFIWSNIARIGKLEQPGRVPAELLKFWSERRLLAGEIGILSPQIVLFATGPNYDDLLQEEFCGIALSPLSRENPVSRMSHPNLPTLSFRSYHPAFLRRRRLERRVKDFVISNCCLPN